MEAGLGWATPEGRESWQLPRDLRGNVSYVEGELEAHCGPTCQEGTTVYGFLAFPWLRPPLLLIFLIQRV